MTNKLNLVVKEYIITYVYYVLKGVLSIINFAHTVTVDKGFARDDEEVYATNFKCSLDNLNINLVLDSYSEDAYVSGFVSMLINILVYISILAPLMLLMATIGASMPIDSFIMYCCTFLIGLVAYIATKTIGKHININIEDGN